MVPGREPESISVSSQYDWKEEKTDVPYSRYRGCCPRPRYSKVDISRKGKRDVVYYLPVAERILCLISGFSRKTDSAGFKALLTPITL